MYSRVPKLSYHVRVGPKVHTFPTLPVFALIFIIFIIILLMIILSVQFPRRYM